MNPEMVVNTRNFRRVVFIAFLAAWRLAAAQSSGDAALLAQAEAQMLSYWWVAVEGEASPRVARITRVGQRGDGHLSLDIVDGTGGAQAPLKGALYRIGYPQSLDPLNWVGAKNYRMEVTTTDGALVTAESAEPGVFTGTFAPRSGSAKPLRLERVSEDEVQKRMANANSDRRAAADRWLAKDMVKIDFVSGYSAFKSTFTVDMKGKTVSFLGSDDFCARGGVPAATRVDDAGMLIFTFNPKRPGCPELQYTFDPVSRVGSIRQRPGDAAPDTPWGGVSRSKVALVAD